MKITFVYSDNASEWNTSNWRCVIPARAINRQASAYKSEAFMIHISEFQANTPKCQRMCAQSDIIIVERNFIGNTNKMVLYWRDQGKCVIANFDDAYNLMDTSNTSYEYWHRNTLHVKDTNLDVEFIGHPDPPILDQFRQGVGLCNAIVTPSRVLCDDWKEFAPAYLLPNYFETGRYTSTVKQIREGVIIGWGGSMGHFQSFRDSGIIAALQSVIDARKNVSLMICGNRQVFDAISIKHKIFQPGVVYDQWPQVISNFDIGLAPLVGLYDDRRSWIKPLEYALEHIPWIASKSQTYAGLESYGTIISNDPEEWASALINHIDCLPAYQRDTRSGFDFAMSQDVNLRVKDILDLFTKIVEETE